METEIELTEPEGLVRITSYQDTARGSRFLYWGGGEKVPGSEVVLWSLPLKEVIGAELKPFSMSETDFKISFQDGSWARLTSSNGAQEIVALLGGKDPAGSAS